MRWQATHKAREQVGRLPAKPGDEPVFIKARQSNCCRSTISASLFHWL